MYLQGFALDPDAIDAHQELRDFSLKRKASGGKAMGFLEAMKLKRPNSDDKVNMLHAEKLMSYDPGNTDHMQSLLQSAYRGGYWDTVLWVGPIFQKANADDKKPDFGKFILLRDVYKGLKRWRLAADACQYALKLRPHDMDLATELKNLGAMDTMQTAGYEKGGSFRDQIRDMNKQSLLLTGDKDFADLDAQAAVIHQAEIDYKAEPNDPSKAMKLVDALEKTEHPDFESKAIDILQGWYDKTKQFRYRQRIGLIHMKQLARMERSKREALTLDPKNEDLRKEYTDFRREQIEFEFKEFELASDAYPTDMRWKFEMGKRMFSLSNFLGSIPVLQQARNDPKYRVDAGILLGVGVSQRKLFGRSGRHARRSDQGLSTSRRRSLEGNVLLARPRARAKGNDPGSHGPLQQGGPMGLQFQGRSSAHAAAQGGVGPGADAAEITSVSVLRIHP